MTRYGRSIYSRGRHKDRRPWVFERPWGKCILVEVPDRTDDWLSMAFSVKAADLFTMETRIIAYSIFWLIYPSATHEQFQILNVARELHSLPSAHPGSITMKLCKMIMGCQVSNQLSRIRFDCERRRLIQTPNFCQEHIFVYVYSLYRKKV